MSVGSFGVIDEVAPNRGVVGDGGQDMTFLTQEYSRYQHRSTLGRYHSIRIASSTYRQHMSTRYCLHKSQLGCQIGMSAPLDQRSVHPSRRVLREQHHAQEEGCNDCEREAPRPSTL